MIGLRWEEDVIYLLNERDIFPHYLLKDPEGVVWASYHKIPKGFRVYNTRITYWNEIDAKNYCEINAKAEIEKKIEYLKSLVRD